MLKFLDFQDYLEAQTRPPGLHGIGKEHGYGHGADTPRDGCHGFCLPAHFLKVHIAAKAIVCTVDAHINDDCPFLDHIGGDEFRASYGSKDKVRLAADLGQIGCP